jgi:hypothetical protein
LRVRGRVRKGEAARLMADPQERPRRRVYEYRIKAVNKVGASTRISGFERRLKLAAIGL